MTFTPSREPLYAGGALRAGYDKVQAEDEMARQEIRRVTNDLRHEADVCYWNHVAQCELVSVADGYRQSVGRLVEVVRQRVEAEYTDRNDLLRNDLLMAEVRLNDADYQVQRARNDAEVARLSLNALAGIPSDQHIATDTLVVPLTVVQPLTDDGNGRKQCTRTAVGCPPGQRPLSAYAFHRRGRQLLVARL